MSRGAKILLALLIAASLLLPLLFLIPPRRQPDSAWMVFEISTNGVDWETQKFRVKIPLVVKTNWPKRVWRMTNEAGWRE